MALISNLAVQPAKQSSEPTVSVLLPVYQAERTIEEAVESILAQSFDDFELLALDDGSTDASVRILEAMAAADDRISVFPHSHVGLVRRLNEGIKLARGSFIARMDADDVCYPDRLEKQLSYLATHPECVAVGTGALLVDAQRMRIRPLEQAGEHPEIESRFIHGDGGALLHASAVYRTEALREIGGYTEKLDGGEDLDLHLRLAEVGRLANLDDCLFEYRQNLEGVCGAQRLQVRRNQNTAIRNAFRRRGLDPASVPPRTRLEPSPTPDETWARWSSWALAAGYTETARKYAMLSFRTSPRRHWKLPVRAWLDLQPLLWQRIARSLGVRPAPIRSEPQAAQSPSSIADEISGLPVVSVLMRTHNDEEFLQDTIDSVLDQTFTHFEFLIVDDASTDSTSDILASTDDSRIRCVSNPERIGRARSLNRGIALAQGRYIARIDPGDLSLPERLLRQVAVLDAESDCAMVATHAERIDALGLQTGIATAPDDRAIGRRLIRENCIVDGSVTFRRRALDEVGLYDETMGCAEGHGEAHAEDYSEAYADDYDLTLRFSDGHLIRVIAEPLYCSRERDLSERQAEEQRRRNESTRDRVRESRVSRVLLGFDQRQTTLEQAIDSLAKLGREEEIGRLEQQSASGTIGALANKLRRSSSWLRWIWEPSRRRMLRSVLNEHLASPAIREQTLPRLRALIDPIG